MICLRISKIQKLNSGKYKIVLNNKEKLITYDDVILKNNLLFDKEIDPSFLHTIESDTKFYDIYTKVLRFLSIRMRSEKEIILYLNKQQLDKEDQKKIIEKLKEQNLINDRLFCKAYISDKLYLGKLGPNRIYQELLEHEIDITCIQEEFEKIEEETIQKKLEKMILKKVSQNQKYSTYVLKQKLLQEMTQLGYEKDMVCEILNQIEQEDHTLEKEYQKQKKKLEKKYQGQILEQKLKQKLFQKGYSMSEISARIEQEE